MKKIMDKLKEKRGDALIFGIALSLFLVMIFATVITLVHLRATASYLQTTAEQVLDTYTATQGRKTVDSFKNGSSYTVELDTGLYKQRLREALGIGSTDTGYTDGRLRFIIEDIKLNYVVTNEINSIVSFNVQIPVYWGDQQVTVMKGTIKVHSRYKVK